MAVNGLINARLQLSGNWGIKYTRTHIGNQNLSNFVNLLGAETRYDITEKIDLGLRGQWLSSGGAAGGLYSFGPTIGFTPIKNVWINTGYNIQGFKDQDFEAANFSRQGAFIQMRLKFDQNTARGLLRRISPAASAAE